MSNRIFIDPEGWFVNFVPDGDQNAETMAYLVNESLKVNQQLTEKNMPVKTIVDLSGVGKIDYGARKSGLEGLTKVQYHRLALVAAKTVFLKNLAKFVITLSRKGNNTRYFDTREEAIEWLKGEA